MYLLVGKETICNHNAPPGAHIIHSPTCNENANSQPAQLPEDKPQSEVKPQEPKLSGQS